MNRKKYIKFMGDLETTVYDGQEFTEVWASAIVQFHTEDVLIFHDLKETIDYLKEFPGHVQLYYHNLKFDGEFWLSYLASNGYKLALKGEYPEQVWKSEKEMLFNEYKYFISDRGLWYYIVIRTNKGFIEIRDSYKLLPYSVAKIAEDFKTSRQKLDLDYTKFRFSGCDISEHEREYIANDVLIVKEALEFMEKEGHTRLTIGSCCFDEFKHQFSERRFYDDFPNIYEFKLDADIYGAASAGDYVRRGYHGGWCYVNEKYEGKTVGAGSVLDVNSLYPFIMHSDSGSLYPVGKPTFWQGNFIPVEAQNRYYFVRFKTRFKLKPGYLPFVHIKGTWLYRGTENLKTSDIYYEKTNSYYRALRGANGERIEAIPTLTMTRTDYELFLEHYETEDFQILDGCYFDVKKKFFDEYIDKYKKIKMENSGAIRESAKLFLTNLYGKMATSKNSSFKVGELNEDGSLSYYLTIPQQRMPGYIPVGAAITSYARAYTIRAAQANYETFCYADTDSIHCLAAPEDIKGVELHDSEFGRWKCENRFDKARFVKQKTYIEVGEEIKIRCAGMPDKSKELFIKSITRDFDEKKHTPEELEFLKTPRSIEDFKRGLKVPGRLKPKRIAGGVILVGCSFEIR